MYEDFFAGRLAALREKTQASARDMSLSLGQNRNYINQIENQKALPSMQGFFYICEYLKVTPVEFFEMGNDNPALLNELIAEAKHLDDTALTHLLGVVREMRGGNRK
jgi:transcriptional regulator with XRE-family HTH domain